MSSVGGSFSHIGLHVGADWLVRCSTYADATPILAIDAGSAAISISVKGRNADQSAVEFARALVKNAQAFAAEVERCHSEQATREANTVSGQAA